MIDCIHGYDSSSSCVECMEERGMGPISQALNPSDLLPVFEMVARYSGLCPECEDRIRQGDKIVKWNDDRFRHEGCEP